MIRKVFCFFFISPMEACPLLWSRISTAPTIGAQRTLRTHETGPTLSSSRSHVTILPWAAWAAGLRAVLWHITGTLLVTGLPPMWVKEQNQGVNYSQRPNPRQTLGASSPYSVCHTPFGPGATCYKNFWVEKSQKWWLC